MSRFIIYEASENFDNDDNIIKKWDYFDNIAYFFYNKVKNKKIIGVLKNNNKRLTVGGILQHSYNVEVTEQLQTWKQNDWKQNIFFRRINTIFINCLPKNMCREAEGVEFVIVDTHID